MKTKTCKVIFQIYVEGGLHQEVTTVRKARKIKEELEREGWNVRVVVLRETIVGLMGVDTL